MAPLPYNPPPNTEQELLLRTASIAGYSLRQLAAELGTQVPSSQKFAKGWIGEILESYLGATAASLPEPDFTQLGVELKTLPLNHNGKPRESTYICMVPLTGAGSRRWHDSIVKRKLSRVLWIPVEADPEIVLARRRIGSGFLWSPDPGQEQRLRRDFEELMDMLSLGELEKVSAHLGEVLQIRPKAVNAGALVKTSNAAGETSATLPRGFYLRPAFTHEILLASSADLTVGQSAR